MNFNDYQIEAKKTCLDSSYNLYYLTMGLVGEAGEIANKVKKVMRGDTNGQVNIDDLAYELGDVLWYVAIFADFLGLNFSEIAIGNIKKLADRQERGTIKGSGDKR